jgi:hypothetical protein
VALLVGLVLGGTSPALAGGGRLAPVQERYQPGEVAVLVGYTGDPVLTTLPEESFFAYLRPAGAGGGARLLRSDVYLGELSVEETAHRGYLRFRVSLTFTVPAYLEPGDYDVVYCDDPCTGALLGDLVDSPVSVGVDPIRRVVREWALDDPEVANLAPDAVLVGPGFSATAAEIRAGRPVTTPAGTPDTTVAPVAAPAEPAPPSVTAPTDEGMAWPLPTALVLAAAAGTGLVLSRRQGSPGARRRWTAPDGRTTGAASAGRG